MSKRIEGTQCICDSMDDLGHVFWYLAKKCQCLRMHNCCFWSVIFFPENWKSTFVKWIIVEGVGIILAHNLKILLCMLLYVTFYLSIVLSDVTFSLFYDGEVGENSVSLICPIYSFYRLSDITFSFLYARDNDEKCVG